MFWGNSGHPNFMNTFEYGTSFLDKLFTKDLEPFWTIGFRYAQIGWGK